MRVSLTPSQLDQVQTIANNQPQWEELDRWLGVDHVVARSSPDGVVSRLSVLMPPDAWLLINEALIARCYYEDGRRRTIERMSSWNTLTRIVTTAINRRTAHPGLRGAAMAGTHIEVLPCWGPASKASFIPFCSLASAHSTFLTLAPLSGRSNGIAVTRWMQGHFEHDSVLEEEALHLRFAREVQRVGRPD